MPTANPRSRPAYLYMTQPMLTPTHDVIGARPVIEPEYSLAELLIRIEWDPVVRRLLGYARNRLTRSGTRARHQLLPDDCVQEAIKLTLEGKRRFERGTVSEFFAFLCGVIKSLVSHDAEKEARQVSASAPKNDERRAPMLDELIEPISIRDDFENEFLVRDDLERFFASIDAELAAYARLRAEGLFPTAEDLACALGISIANVRSMDRRLRRRREQWTNQMTISKTVM